MSEGMRLELKLLGGFEARLEDGRPVTFARKKAQALLAYLALTAGRVHPRDKLAAMLWSEAGAAAARQSLRQTMLAIRQALPGGARSPLLADRDGISADAEALVVDVHEFERLAARGAPEALAVAAATYHGDLLAGLGEQGHAFEEWLLAERSRLHELAVETLARLLAHQMKTDLVEPAIHTAGALLALDPLQEAVHRTLMRLHAGQGRRAAALRQYEACVAALQRDLDAGPEDETKALYQEILRQRPLGPRGDASVRGAPLIGREPELGRLRDALAQASAGRGHVAFVEGEAGIGKTLLLTTLLGDAAGRGARVVVGRAHEGDHVLPFGPWIDALRGCLDDPALAALPASGRAELARLLPELGEPGPDGGDPAAHLRLFETVAQVLARLGARQPVVVALEDLQWADEMSLRLLAFLGARVSGCRLLLVATARTEELSSVPFVRRTLEEMGVTPLALGPLSRADTLALVGTLAAGDAPAAKRHGEHVWRVSEGNPLIAVETLKALRDGEAAPAGTSASPPERVRQVIAGRLGRLDERDRQVVAVASVVGREFDFAVLQRALGVDETESAERVEALVRGRILHGVGERLDFTHERIREVAYAQLSTGRRRLLHRRVGEALEAVHRDALAPHYPALARHFGRAEAWPQAVEYGAHVATQAARGYALDEAIAVLETAGGHAERLLGAERDWWLVRLALREADALFWLCRFPVMIERLERQRARLERVGDPTLAAPFHFYLAIAASFLGDGARTGEHARLALRAAQAGGDAPTAGRAYALLALGDGWGGRPGQGIANARLALEHLAGTGDVEWLGLAELHLAMNHLVVGDAGPARAAVARAEALAEPAGHRRLQTFAAWVAVWAATVDAPADAVEAGRRALTLAPDPMSVTIALAWLGYAHLERGEAAEAIVLLEQAVARSAPSGFRTQHAWFAVWLGDAVLLAGEVDRARQLLTDAFDLAGEARSPIVLGFAQRARGRLARASGDVAGAASDLAGAVRTFTAAEARFEAARTRLELAELTRDNGAAAEHLREARDIFASLGLGTWVARAERVAAAGRVGS